MCQGVRSMIGSGGTCTICKIKINSVKSIHKVNKSDHFSELITWQIWEVNYGIYWIIKSPWMFWSKIITGEVNRTNGYKHNFYLQIKNQIIFLYLYGFETSLVQMTLCHGEVKSIFLCVNDNQILSVHLHLRTPMLCIWKHIFNSIKVFRWFKTSTWSIS